MAQDMEQAPDAIDAERKKGATELLVLSLLEERQRHGYELAQLIERRSRGVLTFHVSLSTPCSTGSSGAHWCAAGGWRSPASAGAVSTS